MIILTASADAPAYPEILEKLEELSLAKKIIESTEEREITLTDGDEVYKGKDAILAHLDDLGRIVHQWYDCHC